MVVCEGGEAARLVERVEAVAKDKAGPVREQIGEPEDEQQRREKQHVMSADPVKREPCRTSLPARSLGKEQKAGGLERIGRKGDDDKGQRVTDAK